METDIDLGKLNFSKAKMKIEEMLVNFKFSFFNLIYILIKNERENFFVSALIIIIEFIQLIAFPINEIFNKEFKDDNYNSVSTFIQYFQLTYLWKGNFLMYILSFTIISIYIIALIIFVFYLAYQINKFTLKSKIYLKTLSFFFRSNSAWFLPIISKYFIYPL